ncbi:MAG: bifunctional oligoribonuclease/PAP phosphatase NrnA [Bacteroidota bacterium]
MENFTDLKAFLSIPRDLVLTSHRNPDGDAIGSTLGMYHYLIQNGHSVKMIFPSDYPLVFGWMPAVDEVLIYDSEPDEAEKALRRSQMVFSLDYNSLERIDKLGEIIAELKVPITMIDHHLYPDGFADFSLSRPSASSTCELVYDFIQLMDQAEQINPTVGECLFAGILTDTGSFKYATSPHLFRIVADLVERGVDDYKLQDLIFNSMEEKQLVLLGHCLANRMEILDEYKTGIITLNRRDYERFDIQRGDTEGIVNFLLKIRNVKIAAFITEQPTIVKISLRSKGDISVQEIAQKYFKGGGHKNASGGSSYKGLRATVDKFKSVLPEFKEMIFA